MPNYFTYNYVNSYIIKEEPITIIDPGPIDKNSNNYLKEKLKDYGLIISDIKRVVLTHGHVDHCGFARYLQEQNKAEIFIHKNDLSKLTLNNSEKIKFKYKTFGNLLKILEFPDEIYNSLTPLFENFYKFGIEVKNVNVLTDKTILDFEKNHIKTIFLPGHTAGSCGFLYNNFFVSGDIILNEVFTTPVLEFDENGKSFRNLTNYYHTLKKLKLLTNIKILPGHGKENFNFKEKVEHYLKYIRVKSEELSKKYNKNLSIRDNFYNIYGNDIDKFFFHFSFFYGMLEFLNIV